MARKVSFRRALRNDNPCCILAIFPFVFLGLGLFIFFSGWTPTRRGPRDMGATFNLLALLVGALLSLGFAGGVAARFSLLRRILAAGLDVEATIVDLRFDRGRGRVQYRYAWDGRTYVDGHAIMESKDARSLQPGGLLRVAVDPRRPSRAVPIDLFCDSTS